MTNEEAFNAWITEKQSNGLLHFNVFLNKQGIAEHFGGEVKWDYDSYIVPFEYIDWTNSTSTEAERREYIYGIWLEAGLAADQATTPLVFNDSRYDLDGDLETEEWNKDFET